MGGFTEEKAGIARVKVCDGAIHETFTTVFVSISFATPISDVGLELSLLPEKAAVSYDPFEVRAAGAKLEAQT